MDGDELIASVYRKIEREKALIAAASNMRQSTDNPLVQQRVDVNIRDGRKNIAYLEEKMRELQIRRIEQEGGGSPGQRGGPAPPPKDGYFEDEAGYPQGGSGSMPSGAPFPDPRPYAPIPKARPNYTKLGTSLSSNSLPLHISPQNLGKSLGQTIIFFGAIGMLTRRMFQISSSMTPLISDRRFSSCCPSLSSS